MPLRKSASLLRFPIYHTHTCTVRTRDRSDKRRLLDPQAYTHRTRESQHGPNRVVGAHGVSHSDASLASTGRPGTTNRSVQSSLASEKQATHDFHIKREDPLSFECAALRNCFTLGNICFVVVCLAARQLIKTDRKQFCVNT